MKRRVGKFSDFYHWLQHSMASPSLTITITKILWDYSGKTDRRRELQCLSGVFELVFGSNIISDMLSKATAKKHVSHPTLLTF